MTSTHQAPKTHANSGNGNAPYAAPLTSYLKPHFRVEIEDRRCIRCQCCVEQCSFGALSFDTAKNEIATLDSNCVACHRCAVFCPTQAISILRHPIAYRENAYWIPEVIEDITRQAETGGVLLTGMGTDKGWTSYWDKLCLNASQVTNPSIDPLREPMELRTYLGAKPDRLELDSRTGKIKTRLAPQVMLEMPILFSAMSYGAISLTVQEGLARAATAKGTLFNTGEGGLHRKLYRYAKNSIVQVASGRFGVSPEYLDAARIVEIKIGQGAKPGIGGHLPGEKVSAEVALTRMIPMGSDALSPAPQHDIYSIEDLGQLIFALKEATNYTKPISVKIAAVHNCAAIASGIARAGADIIAIDGIRGSTGAAPKIIRDNLGIPIEMAIASVDERLRKEGIRNRVSILAAGGFRKSSDVLKAIILGADAVYIGTAALIAVGCTECQACYTGRCAWGITTTDERLSKRQNPEVAAERMGNLIEAWSHEIKEMLGAMGINAIESLRGNRHHLRGIGLTQAEAEILGVQQAGA